MDHNLLRSWLGLSPGSWPPDHYTLLGLANDSPLSAVEPRVLQKMERLRPHQLLHPELVTEGMNRLAQALITLTDPSERTNYDGQLGLKPSAAPVLRPPVVTTAPTPIPVESSGVVVAGPVLDDEVLAEEYPRSPGPDTGDLTQEILLPAELLKARYEIVEEVEPVEARQEAPPVPFEEVVEGVVIEPPPVRPWPTPPSSRRWIYARLAAIRKTLRAWDRLRHVLGDPNDPFDRPGRVLILIETAAEIRPHLQSLTGVVGMGRPGGLVTIILQQTLLLDTLRRLLPDQRLALSIDWWRGRDQLVQEYERLRQLGRSMKAKAEGIPRLPAVVRWLRDFPELLLIAFGLFVLFLAAVRSIIHR